MYLQAILLLNHSLGLLYLLLINYLVVPSLIFYILNIFFKSSPVFSFKYHEQRTQYQLVPLFISAKFLVELALNYPACKMAWTLDGDLLLQNSTGVHQMILHRSTAAGLHAASQRTQIIKDSQVRDMGYSARGTLVLTVRCNTLYPHGFIKVSQRNVGKMIQMELKDVMHPFRVFINSYNMYVLAQNSRIVYKYNSNYGSEGYYEIGLSGLALVNITGFIHVTERGTLLASSPTEDRIYMIDLKTKTCSHFSSTEGEFGHLSSPHGVCSVNNGEQILVCDTDNNRVCVFSHDGRYLHDLDLEKDFCKPTCIAILARLASLPC